MALVSRALHCTDDFERMVRKEDLLAEPKTDRFGTGQIDGL